MTPVNESNGIGPIFMLAGEGSKSDLRRKGNTIAATQTIMIDVFSPTAAPEAKERNDGGPYV